MDRPARERIYYVKAERDAEAGVWYVSSTDVPGLAAEAETPEALIAVLNTLIPELIEANGGGTETSIPYSFILDHLRATRAVA